MPTSRHRAGSIAAGYIANGSIAAVLSVVALLAGCTDERPAGSGTTDAPTTTAAPASTSTSTSTSTSGPSVECGPVSGLEAAPATIASSGQERQFLVAVPPQLDPTTPTPVILNFHGSGSDMDQQAIYSQLPDRAMGRGYVVITPDGTGEPRGWSLGGDLDPTLVDDLLSDLDGRICVDPARIYATGISNGSAFSSILACTKPYRIAAAAMVAAEVGPACDEGVVRSVIGFHGTADPVVPFGGGEVRSSRGVAAPGALDSMTAWAAHDGCRPEPAADQITEHVLRRTWSDCENGASVVFYEITDGGHTWPGAIDLSKVGFASLGSVTDEISATDLILDFFDAHRLGS